MLEITKVSKEDFESSAAKDIEGKSKDQIDKTMTFYYKILTEPDIRTSSFRYFHARACLEGICKSIGDDITIKNLSMFHRNKVQFEIDNPVEKELPKLKANPASRADRFGRASDKSAGQVSF